MPESISEIVDQRRNSDNGAAGPFTVQLPVYDGPMDLLLHVIRQRQIDLLELPVSIIAQDFLTYARAVERVDLDLAGEVIFTAALLLRMKVRRLLPVEEDEDEVEDPEALALRDEELEEQYRAIVAAARELAQGEEKQRQHFTRGDNSAPVEVDETGEMLKDVNLVDLAEAFRQVAGRMKKTPVHQLALFKATVREQSKRILSALKNRSRVRFREIIDTLEERIEVVVAFLAMLELIRFGRVRVRQDALFGEIWLIRGSEYNAGEEAFDTDEESENRP